jgi:uncharacterized membrane protein YidH (DUF202 family)
MRTGVALPVVERGAQLERTLLAWHRTALGLLINGGILARIAFVEDTWWVLGPAGLATGTAFLTYCASIAAYSRRSRAPTALLAITASVPLATAVIATGLSIVVVVLAVR